MLKQKNVDFVCPTSGFHLGSQRLPTPDLVGDQSSFPSLLDLWRLGELAHVSWASWSWSLSFTIETGRFYISPCPGFSQNVHICVPSCEPIKILIVKDPFHVLPFPWNPSLYSCLDVISTSFEFPCALFMSLYVPACCWQACFCVWTIVSFLKARAISQVSLYHSLAESLAHEVLKNICCIEFCCLSMDPSWIFTVCQELC